MGQFSAKGSLGKDASRGPVPGYRLARHNHLGAGGKGHRPGLSGLLRAD